MGLRKSSGLPPDPEIGPLGNAIGIDFLIKYPDAPLKEGRMIEKDKPER
jgi:hypothetical protein